MTSSTGIVHYGEITISYEVRRSARKTLAIDVYPDQRVEVRAPLDLEAERIATIVRKRAPWIVRQQRTFAGYPGEANGRQHVSGESHRYLGRQYRLKVREGSPTGVRLERGLLHVTVRPGTNPDQVGTVLERWYRERARTVFSERLRVCLERPAILDLPNPKVEVRWMKTRWGSCSRTGVIRLNLRLIQAPTACIDYVIIHELCHLKEHNHGKRYYALLDRALPEWRQLRAKLNTAEIK